MRYDYDSLVAWAFDTLKDVSRTFIEPIKHLKLPGFPDLAIAVNVFYNMDRALDTIEDSSIEDKIGIETKKRLMIDFAERIGKSSFSSILLDYGVTPSDMTDHNGYLKLMGNLSNLHELYNTLKPEARETIRDITIEMAHGMADFQTKKVITPSDYDAYTYFVAGTVGKGLTKLWKDYDFVSDVSPEMEKMAIDFGRALQKINIIKDIALDKEEKRQWVPQQWIDKYGLDMENFLAPEQAEKRKALLYEMIDDVTPDIEAALRYIARIKPEHQHIRRFCALPLVLAIDTLELFRKTGDLIRYTKVQKIAKSIKLAKPFVLGRMKQFKNLYVSDGYLDQYVKKLQPSYS